MAYQHLGATASDLLQRVFPAVIGSVLLFSLTACTADTVNVKKDSAAVIAGISEAAGGDDVTDATVLFHITNNRDVAVELLTWNTPLETVLSADLFNVTFNGQAMPYVGRTMKRGKPQAQDFITLQAGARSEQLVDIGRYYDLREAGDYTVTMKADSAGSTLNNNVKVTIDLAAVTVSRR